jgi:hypothetical protein
MKITTCAVMAGAALALVGCAEDFEGPEFLNHMRILAMQAEPPQPSTGQSTTLRALVYQPPVRGESDSPEVVTGYHWSWCPTSTNPQNPSQCLVDQGMANMLFAEVPGVPPLDLGTNETATFVNPFSSSMLAALCQGDYSVLPTLNQAVSKEGALSQSGASLFGCNIAGFPITIQLVVDGMVGGRPKQFPAIFKVYLPVNDAVPRNQNPVVGAINLSEAGMTYPIDEAGTWSAVRGGEAPLLLDLPLSSSEALPNWQDVYLKSDPHVKPHEQLNVYWFTDRGKFGADHKGGKMTAYYGGDPNDSVSPFSNAVENTFVPFAADKYDGDTARLIVVVQDIRNGVSWTTGVVRLVKTPESRDGGVSDRPLEPDSPPDAAPWDGAVEDSDGDAGISDAMVEALP